MSSMKKTVISFILTICMLWTMMPFVAGEASGALISVDIELGTPNFSGDNTFYQFPNVIVTAAGISDIGIIAIKIQVDEEAETGDTVDLTGVTSPGGIDFTVDDADGGLTKTILFAEAVSSEAIDMFIQDIKFRPSEDGEQQMTFIINAGNPSIGIPTPFRHPDGTTHYYSLSIYDKTWYGAYNEAKTFSFLDMKGYLVTITSPEENALITSISTDAAWTAGVRIVSTGGMKISDEASISTTGWVTDIVSASAYYWASGPEAGLVYYDSYTSTGALVDVAFYSSFAAIGTSIGSIDEYPWFVDSSNNPEPNNGSGAGEECMTVNFDGGTGNSGWNDADGSTVTTYFVEFGGYNTTGATILTANGLDVRVDSGSSTISGFQARDSRTVTAPESSPSSSGSNRSSDNTANVLVNGVSHNAGSVSTSRTGGQLTKTLTVDTNRLQSILNSQPTSPQVVLPISGNNDVSQGVLTGQMVKNMEDVEAVLNVETDQGRYILPASDLDVTGLSAQFGEDVNLDDMEITVKISKLSDQQVTAIENTGSEGGWTLMIPPVEFQVEATYNGQTVEVNQFKNYVKREIPIPAGVDPMKITTAVVIGKDGKETHVPTEVFLGEDGLYYARIHSLTNSVYALVYHDMSFDDAVGLWYESTVNEMASRMILKGRDDGRFDGDSPITRAEFAATMVRALGLAEEGTPSFLDISRDQWFAGAVAKASQYGIIQGVGEGRFDPMSHITRQDAMVMIYRSAKIANYLGDSGDSTTIFGDDGRISEYAREAVTFHVNNGLAKGDNGQIRPLDSISRAETATLILRFLQKAELVDTRLPQ